MKRILVLFLITMVMIFSASCTSTTSSDINTEPETEASDTSDVVNTELEPYELSELFLKGPIKEEEKYAIVDRIWFLCHPLYSSSYSNSFISEFGKDTIICDVVFTFENGDVAMVFPIGMIGFTFKDLKEYAQEEMGVSGSLCDLTQQQLTQLYNYFLDKSYESRDLFNEKYADSVDKFIVEDGYGKIYPKINAYTDESGNNLSYETLGPFPLIDMGRFADRSYVASVKIDSSFEPKLIYDTFYGGYSGESNLPYILVTPCNQNDFFELDYDFMNIESDSFKVDPE